jgi:hypothetical protein
MSGVGAFILMMMLFGAWEANRYRTGTRTGLGSNWHSWRDTLIILGPIGLAGWWFYWHPWDTLDTWLAGFALLALFAVGMAAAMSKAQAAEAPRES